MNQQVLSASVVPRAHTVCSQIMQLPTKLNCSDHNRNFLKLMLITKPLPAPNLTVT